jgi:hypothetical protein
MNVAAPTPPEAMRRAEATRARFAAEKPGKRRRDQHHEHGELRDRECVDRHCARLRAHVVQEREQRDHAGRDHALPRVESPAGHEPLGIGRPPPPRPGGEREHRIDEAHPDDEEARLAPNASRAYR